MIPTLIGATMLVFFVVAAAPGGIEASLLSAEGNMRPEQRRAREEYLSARYGLKKPLLIQYLRWVNKVSPVGFRTWELDDPEVKAANAIENKGRDALRPKLLAEGFTNNNVDEELRKRIDEKPDAGDMRLNRPAIKVPDLGDSFTRGRKVSALIAESLPITILINAVAIPIEYVLAVVTGVWAARHRGKAIDVVSGTTSLAMWSLPQIWIAVLAIGFLASDRYLNWFPTQGLSDVRADSRPFLPSGLPHIEVTQAGWLQWKYIGLAVLAAVVAIFVRLREPRSATVRWWSALVAVGAPAALVVAFVWGCFNHEYVLTRSRIDWPGSGWFMDFVWHLVLPVLCISYGSIAFLHKLARASLLDTIQADFVRTARAKGVNERVVLWAHAFRNSLIPLITVLVSLLPAMITGSLIVETVFGINGMGRLTYEAIEQRDRELFLSNTLIVMVLTLGGFLLADILYVLVDPRVTYE